MLSAAGELMCLVCVVYGCVCVGLSGYVWVCLVGCVMVGYVCGCIIV